MLQLTGCGIFTETVYVKVSECTWVEPIYFDSEYLQSNYPELEQDLIKHDAKYEEFCVKGVEYDSDRKDNK